MRSRWWTVKVSTPQQPPQNNQIIHTGKTSASALVVSSASTYHRAEHTYRKNISICGIIIISILISWYLAYAIPVHHNSLCLRSSLLPRAPGPSGTKLICVFLKIQIDTQIHKYTTNANTNRNTSSTLPLHCHSLRLHH